VRRTVWLGVVVIASALVQVLAIVLIIGFAARVHKAPLRVGDGAAWNALITYVQETGPVVGDEWSFDPPCTIDASDPSDYGAAAIEGYETLLPAQLPAARTRRGPEVAGILTATGWKSDGQIVVLPTVFRGSRTFAGREAHVIVEVLTPEDSGLAQAEFWIQYMLIPRGC
jgi:hypothetical protein